MCLPTFKCNNYSGMFNWRIETFSYLLYLDMDTHKYATILDSNLHLSYDYIMFSKYTGKLNDHGMRNIMKNLFLLIVSNAHAVKNTNVTQLSSVNSNSTNSNFFRS